MKISQVIHGHLVATEQQATRCMDKGHEFVIDKDGQNMVQFQVACFLKLLGLPPYIIDMIL